MQDLVRARLLTILWVVSLLALSWVYVAQIPPLQSLLVRIALPLGLACPVLLAALGAGFACEQALRTLYTRLARLQIHPAHEDSLLTMLANHATLLGEHGTFALLALASR